MREVPEDPENVEHGFRIITTSRVVYGEMRR